MTVKELVECLNHVDDAAYAGWIEWFDFDFPLALKYKKILDKIFNLRCRIGIAIRDGHI